MKHPPRRRILPHDGKTVPVRLPIVDNHRQIQLYRQFDLTAEYHLLKFARRILFPVIIQPDFPHRHDFRLSAQAADFRKFRLSRSGAVLRMQSHGGIDMRILCR